MGPQEPKLGKFPFYIYTCIDILLRLMVKQISSHAAWTVHLDLTTDHTNFKALIHGDPVVADLNGDGRNEVIIGTSLGLFMYWTVKLGLLGDTFLCNSTPFKLPLRWQMLKAEETWR